MRKYVAEQLLLEILTRKSLTRMEIPSFNYNKKIDYETDII